MVEVDKTNNRISLHDRDLYTIDNNTIMEHSLAGLQRLRSVLDEKNRHKLDTRNDMRTQEIQELRY